MSLRNKFEKLRIRLRERHRDRRGVPITIEVKEKEYFTCKGCRNRYHSFHVYCPQCLGILEGNIADSAQLKILSVPQGKEEETAQILRTLSGQKTFDFKKALQSLPWIMIQDSEPEILQEWKDALLANNVKTEVQPSPKESKRKNLRRSAPLFTARAPVPGYFTANTDAGIRQIAGSMKNAAVRLKWVEAVLSAYRIVEGLYKRDSYNRILFFDFLLQIDNDLLDAVREFERVAKSREENFFPAIERIQAIVQDMHSEMEEVQHQVKRTLDE